MSSPFRLVILDDYQKAARDFADWDALGPAVDVKVVHRRLQGDELVSALSSAHGVVAMRERTPFPRETLDQLPALQLLVTTGLANSSIDMDAARQLGITVCGTESSPSPVVELTWGLILGLVRGVDADARAMRSGGWQSVVGGDVYGKTLGVFGPGRIGGAVANVGRALGMNVLAWSPNLTPERAACLGVTAVPEVSELMRQSDVVTMHLRLSEQSRGLIDDAELMLMPAGSYFVNTARSAIVNEGALLRAVQTGHLAGVGLDVYDIEPVPVDSPLRSDPRIITTSHMGYVSTLNYGLFYGQAWEGVKAYLAGSPMRVLNLASASRGSESRG